MNKIREAPSKAFLLENLKTYENQSNLSETIRCGGVSYFMNLSVRT